MAQGNEFDNFVGGFVLGALLGVAVGLLLAPAQGSEFRKQLREQSARLKSQAVRRADALQAKGQQIYAQQKSRFQEAVEEGKRAAAARREELLAHLESGVPGAESIEVPTNPS